MLTLLLMKTRASLPSGTVRSSTVSLGHGKRPSGRSHSDTAPHADRRPIRLRSSILGIYTVDERRTAIMIPEGAIVYVVSGPIGQDRMVDVRWDEKVVAVFAVDLTKRGSEVQSIRGDRAAFA